MSELEQFRDEVRTFLSEKLTPELQRAGRLEDGIYADLPIAEEWLAILNEQGWAVPDWPVEWGGTGWSAEQHAVWQQELTLASAPALPPNGTLMVAPAIMHYASEEQKNYYLPRMRNGQDWWAQGYSEPGAGSDLSPLSVPPCATVTNTSSMAQKSGPLTRSFATRCSVWCEQIRPARSSGESPFSCLIWICRGLK